MMVTFFSGLRDISMRIVMNVSSSLVLETLFVVVSQVVLP